MKLIKPFQPNHGFNLVEGTVAMVVANVFGASMAGIVKLIGNQVPTTTILFFQLATCMALVFPIVIRKGWRGFYTKKPFKHFFRALIGTISFWMYYKSINMIPLVDASLLTLTAPIWVPPLALITIKESMPRWTWLGIGCGFIGVVIVFFPFKIGINLGSLLALGSGVSLAGVYVMLKHLSSTEDSSLVIFYYALFTSCVTAPFFFVSGQEGIKNNTNLLILLGVLIFALDYSMLFSFKRAPASIMSALTYLTVIFSGLIDWLGWGHIPSSLFILGSFFIILGGTWTILLGRKGVNPII